MYFNVWGAAWWPASGKAFLPGMSGGVLGKGILRKMLAGRKFGGGGKRTAASSWKAAASLPLIESEGWGVGIWCSLGWGRSHEARWPRRMAARCEGCAGQVAQGPWGCQGVRGERLPKAVDPGPSCHLMEGRHVGRPAAITAWPAPRGQGCFATGRVVRDATTASPATTTTGGFGF